MRLTVNALRAAAAMRGSREEAIRDALDRMAAGLVERASDCECRD